MERTEKSQLAKAQYSFMTSPSSTPWGPQDIDKMDSAPHKNYGEVVKECRFFYRKDPIAGTVVDKLIEIGITDLVISKGKLSPNELKIFTAVKDKLQEFAETCAVEYLLTGLVYPEVKFASLPTSDFREYGIKKMSTISVPVSMWVRDSSTIKINSPEQSDMLSYYLVVPDKTIFFITNKGMYPDGTTDVPLYEKWLKYYPVFVAEVRKGTKEFKLEPEYTVSRRKPLADSSYPTPYLHAALESLKHKRNLKRLDYSLAARAIGAIQQFKVGSDDFPVTEDESETFQSLKDQMTYRNSGGRDLERIFQLFTNHTVEIKWVYPPLEPILDDKKYIGVNEDIFYSLGFPRILTTGESQRSGTSEPEYATLSPVKTMNNMQRKILQIIKDIVKRIATENNLSDYPEVRFKPISLHSFVNFIEGLRNLYDTGNLSRSTYVDAFGYVFEDEAKQLSDDKDTMKSYGLDDFAPKPYSNQPGAPKQPETPQDKPKTAENTNKTAGVSNE